MVRVRTIDDKGFLTVKGITTGATRMEFEYEIPVADANAMLDELCERHLIEKKGTKLNSGDLSGKWTSSSVKTRG